MRFKEYLDYALYEESEDLTVWEMPAGDFIIDFKHWNGVKDIILTGILYIDGSNPRFIGPKAALQKWNKMLHRTAADAKKAFEKDAIQSTQFIATPMISQYRSSTIKDAMGYIINKQWNSKQFFGLAILRRNETRSSATNVLVIHDKDVDVLSLPNVGDGTDMHGVNSHNWGSAASNLLLIYPQNEEKYDVTTDPNYIWIQEHLHEVTSSTQKKNGTFAFMLPKPRKNQHLVITNTGYVRVIPINGIASVIFYSKESSAAERDRECFEQAVKWLKKNS